MARLERADVAPDHGFDMVGDIGAELHFEGLGPGSGSEPECAHRRLHTRGGHVLARPAPMTKQKRSLGADGTVLDDDHGEGVELMRLQLSNPSGAAIADGVACGAINNNEASGTIADDDEATTQLTAHFESLPAEHDGSRVLTLRIAFSEEIKITKRNFQAHSLSVSGGTVANARRVDQRGDLWEVTVEPSSFSPVTVSIASGRACDVTEAICTDAGRMLASSVSTTVQGPTALTVADARVREGPGVALAFLVTLDRSRHAAVTVDYATSDATATAGENYTAASGTLTFAASEQSKMLEPITACLADCGRIEIRGFGSFSLHLRVARVVRNSRTGSPVSLPARPVTYFKLGKALRERVDRQPLEAHGRSDGTYMFNLGRVRHADLAATWSPVSARAPQ